VLALVRCKCPCTSQCALSLQDAYDREDDASTRLLADQDPAIIERVMDEVVKVCVRVRMIECVCQRVYVFVRACMRPHLVIETQRMSDTRKTRCDKEIQGMGGTCKTMKRMGDTRKTRCDSKIQRTGGTCKTIQRMGDMR